MLSAIGRISPGISAGTSAAHFTSESRVIAVACARSIPRRSVERAFSLSREPPQSGQRSCFRNFSTRFIPWSSFTFASAFSTV